MEDVKLLLTHKIRLKQGEKYFFTPFPKYISSHSGKNSHCECVFQTGTLGYLQQQSQRVHYIASAMCLNNMPASLQYSKWKTIHKMISESDVTYSQLWWPILGIRALHLPIQVHTHSSGHKHTPWTHTHTAVGSHLCCGARGAVWGFGALLKGTSLWYWKWRERCTFTPPTDNPCQTEIRTRNLSIMSPTLYH